MKKIEINPITRLEGHGKIAIFLDDNGDVKDAFFQVVEFRGYEKFLQGMPIEEVPRTVSTVCGVCRGVHFTAAMKAVDGVYGVKPTEVAKKIREIYYASHYIEDHTVILYALGLPDFVVGPESDPKVRNIVGLIQAVGKDVAKDVLKKRAYAVNIFEMLGGKPNHPVAAIPGGWSKPISDQERDLIDKWADELIELGKITVKIFKDIVLKNPQYEALIKSDIYNVKVGYMGTVNSSGEIEYYDGTQRIIDANGNLVGEFKDAEYLDFIKERVVPWSYLKFPYNKKLGNWDGIYEGDDTNLYSVGPLARFNVAKGMDTELAHEEFLEFQEYFNKKPVHYIQAYHWARAIEILNAAEKIKKLINDPDITNKDIVAENQTITGVGYGIIEAPRGTLIHHYETDDNAIVTKANLIVATTHNNGPINLAIKKAAKHFIKKGKVDSNILNYVEMAFRPYDLCLACATHQVKIGHVPIEIVIYDSSKEPLQILKNF